MGYLLGIVKSGSIASMISTRFNRFKMSFLTHHSSFVIRHSSLFIRHLSLLLFLLLPSVLSAQPDVTRNVTVNLGKDAAKSNASLSGIDPFLPVTISPGVPVTLTAQYGMIANSVATVDNRVEGPFDIGFPFTFYGDVYTKFSIGDNGWISFTHDINWGATRNIRLPSADPKSPKNCILGAMEDYDPGQEGGPFIFYQTIGQAPHRSLVVMWCQCPMVGCPSTPVTFQIVLKEGDTIETHISSKPVCTSWDNKCTIGIQDITGYLFETPQNINRNSTSWSASQEAWRFVPTSLTTYSVTSIPYKIVPITPGDKIEYRWYEGSGTEPFSWDQMVVVVPNETTTYLVTATICNGETFNETVTVTVEPQIPNAFAPNSIHPDNAKFNIKGLPADYITRYNIKIYNRWGQMVFMSDDILDPWDGSLNNSGVDQCPDGVYVWVVYYETSNKSKVTNKGTVTLFR